MHKILFKISVFAILAITLFTIVTFASTNNAITYTVNGYDTSQLLFGSNNYTQKDDLKENTIKGEITEKDVEVTSSSDEHYTLYVNKELGIFKVKNNTTGYVYYSALDKMNEGDATTVYASYMSSSFVIEYYKYNTKTEQNALLTTMQTVTSVKKLSRTEKEELGELEVYPLKINRATTTKLTYNTIENGIKVTVNYSDIGISLTAYITLSNEGLNVKIPDEEIVEDKNLLANIIAFPAFGATYDNLVEGYMVIPDGSGALIRYGETAGSSQQNITFFGNDIGIGSKFTNADAVPPKDLSMPVFGMINGIKQDGVYGIIESGAYASDLVISPAGALNIKYNYLTVRYNKRYIYLLYGVNQTIQKNRDNQDISTLYSFLENDEATYVGMANDYQQYLVDNDVLSKQTDPKYRTRFDFLMSEVTKALFGTKTITMTKVKDVQKIMEELTTQGIDDYQLVLNGWNASGYSASTPYNIKYNGSTGNKRSYQELMEFASQSNGKVYVYNDYTTAYKNGNISVRSDVARNVQNLKMTVSLDGEIATDKHYLYPTSTKEIATKDIKTYKNLGINSLAIQSLGNVLYSYIKDNKHYNRYDSVKEYQSTLENLEKEMNIALYSPNSYTFKYLDDYLDMTMYSSGYSFYTDSVPFVPYVIRGHINYYSKYVNFQANGINQMLRMLDYGAFPSYVLTTQASYNLKYTLSNTLYTTAYTDFKEKIVSINDFLEEGFNETVALKIVDRQVIQSGVIVITYDNGTKLVINYTDGVVSYNGQNISANNYKVIK